MSETPYRKSRKNHEGLAVKNEIFAQGTLCALGNMLEKYLPKHVQFLNDPDVHRYIASQPPFDTEQQRAWLKEREAGGDKVYAILVPDKKGRNTYVGAMSFMKFNAERTTAESGSFIGDKRFWQKGIAREARFLQLKLAFENLGLQSVTSVTIAPNVRSQRLLESTGYKLTETRQNARIQNGEPHDELHYMVTPESWKTAYEQYLENCKG